MRALHGGERLDAVTVHDSESGLDVTLPACALFVMLGEYVVAGGPGEAGRAGLCRNRGSGGRGLAVCDVTARHLRGGRLTHGGKAYVTSVVGCASQHATGRWVTTLPTCSSVPGRRDGDALLEANERGFRSHRGFVTTA